MDVQTDLKLHCIHTPTCTLFWILAYLNMFLACLTIPSNSFNLQIFMQEIIFSFNLNLMKNMNHVG